MTLKLLIDFPWNVESMFDAHSDAFDALNQFERIRADERLSVVPFISEQDYLRLVEDPRPAQPGAWNVLSPVLRALESYVQWQPGRIRAEPRSGPNDCGVAWQCGLGDELARENWRTPQLLLVESRLAAWRASIAGPASKADAVLRRERRDDDDLRVVSSLETYYDHEHATSDRDPWDLRRLRPLDATVPAHKRHACQLPKPPSLQNVAFEELRGAVARILDWHIGGKWFYVPSDNWDFDAVSQIDWREKGRTFPHIACPHCGHDSPIDRWRQVWCWDKNERHWDVQLQPDYWKISHDGQFLRKAPNTRRFRR